ncbi:LysR family transcriptional regulator [Streptomyces coeruleoprunus]|uniref:LysR family transcriptional regulator n=1 Tax=Streptomyces coeruleoprunus TaxID=285563 RepID=A0ABV9XC64_9ACTN
MDLLALRHFQVVARHEHISRAAAELRVAQPSVSRTIGRLERELGVPLFDRTGRRIRLNAHGRAFLRRVDRALGELADARREIADAEAMGHGTVAVAAETLLSLTGTLAAFRAAHPRVAIRLFQATAEEMARLLQAREVDLCVASQPVTGPALHREELIREEVFLAVPHGHPLTRRDRVTVRDLVDEPFISTRPGHWQRALLDRLFAAEGLRPAITCEGDEPGAVHELITAGLGVGLLPAMSRLSAHATSVAWLRIEAADCVRTLTLVRHADTYLPSAARRLADLLVRDLSEDVRP